MNENFLENILFNRSPRNAAFRGNIEEENWRKRQKIFEVSL